MKKFTKSDLRDGDVVEYRNGALRIVKGEKLYNNARLVYNVIDYDENLKNLSGDHLDIVKVYRPIWKREEPTITTDEKVILRNVDSKYKYIGRDMNGLLCAYKEKPEKDESEWSAPSYVGLFAFRHLFSMVKWEDEEPRKIEDLLNLDVKKDG